MTLVSYIVSVYQKRTWLKFQNKPADGLESVQEGMKRIGGSSLHAAWSMPKVFQIEPSSLPNYIWHQGKNVIINYWISKSNFELPFDGDGEIRSPKISSRWPSAKGHIICMETLPQAWTGTLQSIK